MWDSRPGNRLMPRLDAAAGALFQARPTTPWKVPGGAVSDVGSATAADRCRL